MKKLLMCSLLIFCILICSACHKIPEEVITEETTQEETIQEETTKQESTKEESDNSETTKNESTKDETTKQETTTDETTTDETSKQEADSENEEEIMVWVSGSGSKYHSKSSCSNMKSPKQITLEEAEEQGYEPCKKCH